MVKSRRTFLAAAIYRTLTDTRLVDLIVDASRGTIVSAGH